MSKVRVSDFRGLKQIEPKIVKFNDLEIAVKQFVPFSEKNLIVKLIVNNIFQEYGIDYLNENLMLTYCILKYYTNINLPTKKIEFEDADGKIVESYEDDVYGIYDLSVGSGLFNAVVDAIPQEEYEMITDGVLFAIRVKKDEIKKKDGLPFIVQNLLNELINKIPEKNEIDDTIDKVKNLDPKLVEEITNIFKSNNNIK